VLIELVGFRLLTDPTFDAPGRYQRAVVIQEKTTGPALASAAIGATDAVLLSRDQHIDNLDQSGRAFLPRAGCVFTTPVGAERASAKPCKVLRSGRACGSTLPMAAACRSRRRRPVCRTIICSPTLLAAFMVVAVTSNGRAADYSLACGATKGALGPLMTSTVLRPRPRARTAPRRQDLPHNSFRLRSSTESRVAALRVVFQFGDGIGNELDRGV
jgi:hypothetical protein